MKIDNVIKIVCRTIPIVGGSLFLYGLAKVAQFTIPDSLKKKVRTSNGTNGQETFRLMLTDSKVSKC